MRDGRGGGIEVAGGRATLEGSTVSNNSAPGADPRFGLGGGGGIGVYGTVVVANSTVKDNTAATAGGGMEIEGGSVTLANGTFSGNTASVGGGINNNGDLTVQGSTIRGNRAGNQGGI